MELRAGNPSFRGSKVTKASDDYLRELKAADPFTGFRLGNTDGLECKIQILGRGESVFVQLGSRALVVDAIVAKGIVVVKSIQKWDDKSKVSSHERDVILEYLRIVFEQKGVERLTLV